MTSTLIISLIIAVLAGAATFYAWNQNRAVSLAAAVVCLIASAIAVITGLIASVALIFKLLPWLLLAFGIWLVYRTVTQNNDGSAQGSVNRTSTTPENLN